MSKKTQTDNSKNFPKAGGPPRHLWLCIYTHEQGTAVIPFWYEPSEHYPYPATDKIVEGLKLPFDPELNETVRLQEVEPLKLPLASYSTGHGGHEDPAYLFKGLDQADRDEEWDESKSEEKEEATAQ